MKFMMSLFQGHIKAIVVILLISAVYSMARLPNLPDSERMLMASRFGFARAVLPGVSGRPQKYLRTVHSSLNGISAWISAVGAAVSLNDLDGDGLPNDVCYVDTRTDQVIVAQVPGTPACYEPFTLDAAPLPYDRDTMAPMGCLPGDFNEDGLMDILVYYWGRTPILFLRKGVDASTSRVPLAENLYARSELIPNADRWYTNAATQADLDGDGHVDILIGNYFPDGARILDAKDNGFEHMQHSMSRAFNGGRNRFLLWAGASSGPAPTAQFDDVKTNLSDDVVNGWTLGAGAADLDGDLLPEIYFANDFGPDRLLHNLSRKGELRFEVLEGKRKLTTPGSKVLGRDSFKGMGVDFGDINGDGLPDIFVSNIAAEYALEESHFVWISNGKLDLMKVGVAPYADESEELGLSRSGWGWDMRLGDFDNDGVLEVLQATGFLKGEANRWPELHELAMSNDQLLQNPSNWPRFHPGDEICGHSHNQFFVRAKDGRYYDLAHEMGLDQVQVSRGIATADVDGDGRLDYAVANQWDASWFYQNKSQDAGAFLGLHLLLPLQKAKSETTIFNPGLLAANVPSRPAIGACATVYLPDGRTLVSQVDGGNGHSGKRSPYLHFGLGHIPPDTQIRVDLRWRDPEGRASLKTFYLSPGWHSILLGW
jgi:hypothetical protein